MRVRSPELSAQQLVARRLAVDAISAASFEGPSRELASVAAGGVWLPPPLLTVAAAVILTVTDDALVPLELDERVWDSFLPERRPQGRSEWRNANYALQAAGCLAGGVWLDVGRQESFWHLPLWPYALDVVELLTKIATQRLSTTDADLACAVSARLEPETASLD